jgi:hypothetical protein
MEALCEDADANFRYILLSPDVVIYYISPLRENIPKYYVPLARN